MIEMLRQDRQLPWLAVVTAFPRKLGLSWLQGISQCFFSLILHSLDLSWDLYPSLVIPGQRSELGIETEAGHLAVLVKALEGKNLETND